MINCNIELKLKWINHCVFSALGADNTDANSNNIIFTVNDAKLCLSSLYQRKSIKNNQNFSAKDFKDQFIGMNIIQKNENKGTKISTDIFSN